MGIFDIFKKKKEVKRIKPENDNKVFLPENGKSEGDIIEIDEKKLKEIIYEWESSEEIINSLLSSADNQTRENIKFVEYLINIIDSEKLEIPALPDIIIKIMKLSQDPDTEISKYVQVVKSDQAIALKIIKLANSPLYKGLRDVNDLNLAVSRIGINELKNIVIMMSLQTKIFRGKKFKDLIDEIWKSSLLTALISSQLASYYSLDSSRLYTLALLEDVGEIIVLDAVRGYESFYKMKYKPDEHFILRTAKSFHQQISAFTLAHWNFSKEQIRIVRNHHVLPDDKTDEYNKVLFVSYQTALIVLKFKFTDSNIENFPYDFILKFSKLPLKRDAFIILLRKSLKQFNEFISVLN